MNCFYSETAVMQTNVFHAIKTWYYLTRSEFYKIFKNTTDGLLQKSKILISIYLT